ncbi:HET-domain-containing protein, partial [Hyaloscypha bicolor E]
MHLKGSPAARAIAKRPLPCPSDSDAAFNWVKSEIRSCDRTHIPCRFSVDRQAIGHPDDQILPTRIIDLTENDISGSLRLIETHGQKRGRWAALSHCWGDPKASPLKTTSATLAQHLEEIPLSALPETFLDAIRITRKLGLRYIWIDSICIVQDDERDWLKEASLMGNIYQRAYVTIAASDSPNSLHGCFNRRWYSTLSLQSLELPFYSCHGSTGALRRRGTFAASIESDDTGLKDAVLQSRGWITQEWILSRRIIHYRQNHIFWCCRVHGVKDSGQEFEDVIYNWNMSGVSWNDVVERHSDRAFTFAKDKLISLDGLATALKHMVERWRRHFHGEYRFGIWSETLPNCLFWIPVGIHADPHMAHVPTWSWA